MLSSFILNKEHLTDESLEFFVRILLISERNKFNIMEKDGSGRNVFDIITFDGTDSTIIDCIYEIVKDEQFVIKDTDDYKTEKAFVANAIKSHKEQSLRLVLNSSRKNGSLCDLVIKT